jgi:hypothetical protein
MYAVDMLGALGLPEGLIEEVRGMLATRAEELEGSKPSEIGDVFGGSGEGAMLGHHAAIARSHVADAVLQMADGLRGYSAELAGHVDRMTGTDAQSAVDLTRLEASTSCVAAPDFSTNGGCSASAVPTGEGH